MTLNRKFEIHQELRRKGVTFQLLWEEYADANSDEHHSYSHFCVLCREWRQRLSPTMRQTHTPSDKKASAPSRLPPNYFINRVLALPARQFVGSYCRQRLNARQEI
jgi:hypothetical protein